MKYPCDVSGTPQQAAAIVEKRTALRRRLAGAREVQTIYMPCVASMVANHHQAQRRKGVVLDLVEEQPLFFPSNLSLEDLDTCEPGLAKIEHRLCVGQLRDSLDKLRVQLHIKTRLITFKNVNVCHQGANTRAQQKIQANERMIRGFAEEYRAAREATTRLLGTGDWEHEWRELRQEDVRCMQELETDPRTHRPITEGRRKVSWIWMSAGREGESSILPGIDDGAC